MNEPYYSLKQIQSLISSGESLITKTARLDAEYIGYNTEKIYETIKKLSVENFYKSMESNRNPLLVQDVYHFEDIEKDLKLYIKLQIKENAVVISFKESDAGY